MMIETVLNALFAGLPTMAVLVFSYTAISNRLKQYEQRIQILEAQVYFLTKTGLSVNEVLESLIEQSNYTGKE